MGKEKVIWCDKIICSFNLFFTFCFQNWKFSFQRNTLSLFNYTREFAKRKKKNLQM